MSNDNSEGSTRRQFLGAAATLAALPGLESVAPAEGETLGFSPESEKEASRDIKVTQTIGASFKHASFSTFDDDPTGTPDVYASADRNGEVVVNPVGYREDGKVGVQTFLTFQPEDAEFFAAVLLELAAKARNGEEWRYP